MSEQESGRSQAAEQRRVLYIEDNAINLQFMQMFFDEFDDLQLITATSAEQGIEVARQSRLDLILMDIDLPGLDGIEATRQLKSMPETAELPIIAITASAMVRDIDRARSVDFDAYVTKPFKLDEFTVLMRSVLERNAD